MHSQAPNGDTVEITADGPMSIHPKSVGSGGTFVHRAADGSVKGSGTWDATQLLSFDSYGTSPSFPPTFEGGKMVVRVNLHPGGDTSVKIGAVATIVCAVGNPLTGLAIDGVTLAVGNGLNFNEIVSGATIFIRQ